MWIAVQSEHFYRKYPFHKDKVEQRRYLDCATKILPPTNYILQIDLEFQSICNACNSSYPLVFSYFNFRLSKTSGVKNNIYSHPFNLYIYNFISIDQQEDSLKRNPIILMYRKSLRNNSKQSFKVETNQHSTTNPTSGEIYNPIHHNWK